MIAASDCGALRLDAPDDARRRDRTARRRAVPDRHRGPSGQDHDGEGVAQNAAIHDLALAA